MLVLGAGGFLGSHLARAAAAEGFAVVVAARRPRGEAPGCDLLDPASIASCLGAAAPDLVVNAAGAASVGRSWERPGETFAANATGVLNLLEAMVAGAPEAHLLCLSSADVYGAREAEELPLGEQLEPRPLTPYGASKAAMEVLCGQFARAHGLRVGVARAFNLVGPGQAPDFAVSGFAREVAAAERGGGTVELALGNGDAARDFTDVRDAARALLGISRQRLVGTFNLCSGEATTMAELVAELGAQARAPVSCRADPGLARPADPPALVGDPARLREATGYAPEIPLRRSLGDLLEWWRERLASA